MIYWEFFMYFIESQSCDVFESVSDKLHDFATPVLSILIDYSIIFSTKNQ